MKGMGLKNNINAYSCHVVSSCETRYLAPEFRPMRSYKIRPEYSQRRLRSGPCLGACIEILSVSLFNRRAPHSIHSLAQSASGSDTARSFDVAGIPVTPS